MRSRIRNKGHKDSRQNVILIVIILLIGIWVIPTSDGIMMKEHTQNKDIFFSTVSTISGNILHVGGSGSGNYSKIQDAVDNSSDGDTVYVHFGIYYEHITVDKTIVLLGEKRETTIIDGSGIGDVVSVYADGVNISGFTVQNSGDSFPEAGIEFHSDNNAIVGNIISRNGEFGVGIFLNGSAHNEICDNRIYENGNEGIYLEGSAYNLIQSNEIFSNGHCAVVISRSSYNTVVDNDMYGNHAAMSLWHGSTYNEIARNTIYGHPWSGMGIWEGSDYNSIHHNNFYNNSQYGITLLETKENVIDHNTISGSEKGIEISYSNRITISGNTIRNNSLHGICSHGPGSSYMIIENVITDNTYGIYLVESSGSIISGNTITNNENGIYIVNTHGTIISANTIRNKWNGIHLEKSYNNTVSNNTIMDNADGIYMHNSSGNLFSENTITNNEWFGIWFTGSSDNIVVKNNISNNDDIGVYLAFSSNDTITENIITGNAHGIYLEYSSSIMIHKNILRNDLNAYFVASLPAHCKNKWNRNYWDRPRFFPFRISGMVKRENIPLFSWVNFDWRPLFVQPIGTMGSVNDGPSFGSGTFGLGGDTLYVGGDGSDNYSTIQEAIDASNHDDTIYVYSGIYYENIVVDKGITLHGEEKNTTVIDGIGYGDIISILADHVVVHGFTIANGHFGILIRNTSYHRIEGNNISNNLRGISLQGCRSVLITNNIFYYNQYDIRLYSSSSISVHRNNFGGTYKSSAFFTGLFATQYNNSWRHNYWGSSRLLPYPISGKIIVGKMPIHWLAFDWFPARSPYLL